MYKYKNSRRHDYQQQYVEFLMPTSSLHKILLQHSLQMSCCMTTWKVSEKIALRQNTGEQLSSDNIKAVATSWHQKASQTGLTGNQIIIRSSPTDKPSHATNWYEPVWTSRTIRELETWLVWNRYSKWNEPSLT